MVLCSHIVVFDLTLCCVRCSVRAQIVVFAVLFKTDVVFDVLFAPAMLRSLFCSQCCCFVRCCGRHGFDSVDVVFAVLFAAACFVRWCVRTDLLCSTLCSHIAVVFDVVFTAICFVRCCVRSCLLCSMLCSHLRVVFDVVFAHGCCVRGSVRSCSSGSTLCSRFCVKVYAFVRKCIPFFVRWFWPACLRSAYIFRTHCKNKKLTSQIVADLASAKQECCFCIPAGRNNKNNNW